MVDKPEHQSITRQEIGSLMLCAGVVIYLGGLSALLVYDALNKEPVKEKSEIERLIDKYDTHIKDRKLDKYELPDLLEAYKKK